MHLRDLSPVLSADGPFVTVHVGAESAVEQAADRYELAWKNVLKQLEEEGVAEPVRDAVFGARGDHADGEARLVVASVPDAKVLVSAPLQHRPNADVAQVGPLPRLMPLVIDLSQQVPHVVVHADRTGADITAYYDSEKVSDDAEVKGRTLHLRKVPSGGWSHRRYQARAENQWRDNAKEITDTVVELAEHVGAELIIGVGDVRELGFVKDGLGQPWDERWVEVEGGRTEDGSEEAVEQRVRDTLALHVAAETLQLLEEFAQERGQNKRACDGVEDVVQALRKAQVETLLITTSADESATLWYGSDPSAIGTTRSEVEALGEEAPQEGPLLDVLVRAALASGAGVQLVPHQPVQAPDGGVGAVLRYHDDDTAAARS